MCIAAARGRTRAATNLRRGFCPCVPCKECWQVPNTGTGSDGTCRSVACCGPYFLLLPKPGNNEFAGQFTTEPKFQALVITK